ncbi:MAG: RpoL/Rpb11 RNA polymerase subunit family protein [Thermoplasmata archaeon]
MTMKINLISKEKQSIRFEILGADETIVMPLLEEILADANVEEARAIRPHPYISNYEIYVKVKDIREAKPQTIIKKAAKNLETKFAELHDEVAEKPRAKGM